MEGEGRPIVPGEGRPALVGRRELWAAGLWSLPPSRLLFHWGEGEVHVWFSFGGGVLPGQWLGHSLSPPSPPPTSFVAPGVTNTNAGPATVSLCHSTKYIRSLKTWKWRESPPNSFSFFVLPIDTTVFRERERLFKGGELQVIISSFKNIAIMNQWQTHTDRVNEWMNMSSNGIKSNEDKWCFRNEDLSLFFCIWENPVERCGTS